MIFFDRFTPTILIFLAFLASLGAAVYTHDAQVYTIAVTLSGALAGVSVQGKKENSISVDNVENVENK